MGRKGGGGGGGGGLGGGGRGGGGGEGGRVDDDEERNLRRTVRAEREVDFRLEGVSLRFSKMHIPKVKHHRTSTTRRG